MVLIYRAVEFIFYPICDVSLDSTYFTKLCRSLTGHTIEMASIEAIKATGITPEIIQSDNGSCYISC
jgi:hypothetical protein